MSQENQENNAMKFNIGLTWYEFGIIYSRFAETGEVKSVKKMRKDFSKAMALADALTKVVPTFTKEQKEVISQELALQLQEVQNG